MAACSWRECAAASFCTISASKLLFLARLSANCHEFLLQLARMQFL